MNSLIRFTLPFLMLALFSSNAEAQLFDRLKNKVQEKVEEKVEDKIDREIERAAENIVETAWNSIFDEDLLKGNPGEGSPFTSGMDVNTESQYNFYIATTMEITTVDENGQSDAPMIMKMYFNENELYTGTRFHNDQLTAEQGDVFVIYDINNTSMIMLMENDGERFSFAYGWEQAEDIATEIENEYHKDENWDEIDEWQGFTRIGSKQINGYHSEGYRFEDNQITTDVWVTREESFGMENMFGANSSSKQLSGKIPDQYPYGMLMEMITENQETGEITTMKVTDIDKNTRLSYSIKDYPMISWGDSMNEE